MRRTAVGGDPPRRCRRGPITQGLTGWALSEGPESSVPLAGNAPGAAGTRHAPPRPKTLKQIREHEPRPRPANLKCVS